ncbi:unnamed protein product, partial [Meganyctiphanes norvegica]
MAATQASINSFFKTKKSARDVHSLKNGKPVIKEDIKPVQVDNKCDIVKENAPVESDAKTEAVVFAKPEATPRRTVARSSKPSSRNSSSKRGEKPKHSGEDIIEALRRAAAKQTKVGSKLEDGTTSEDEIRSAPTTPKRKKEEDEEVMMKKRREVNELNAHTPTQDKDLNVTIPTTPKSAMKSLFKEPIAKTIENHERKMTPAEIKEKLGKCGRLDILRERLLKVNQTGDRLREFKENQLNKKTPPPSPRKVPPSPRKAPHPQLKDFGALDVNVPVSPRKTPVKTPTKTPIKLPSYKRYAHLTERPSEELMLPGKYRLMKEFFRAVDTVISLLHNRHEVITYSKLKPAVEEMMRKVFHEKYLGQIKTVFPMAYIFKQEKKKNCGGGVKDGSYQLTVAPNMDYKNERITVNLMDKFESHGKGTEKSSGTYQKMDSTVMIERRNIFHNCLVEIVKDQHDHFLKSLDPPIVRSTDNIKRWHPEFELEDVTDIHPTALPQPLEEQKFNTAKDVLDKASDMFSVNHRMEAAVAAAVETTKSDSLPVTAEPPKPATPVNTALKGISSSLLEKIRAREAAKTARDMTRTKTENKELEMLSRLPEIARIIRTIFVTEKKAALPWEMITSKVSATYSGMLLSNETDAHLNKLIKEVPGWATICKVQRGIYLKINRNTELSEINNKLQATIYKKH